MSKLQDALNKQRKKNANLKVGKMSEFDLTPKALSTNNVVLDWITSIGGLPKGRISELSGPSQSGKTTAAIQAAAKYQQSVKGQEEPRAIVYLDFEHSLDEAYCRSLGLDPDDDTFVLVQPHSLEEGANLFRSLLTENLVEMCIFDSVAAAVPIAEKEKDTGAVTIGDRAKALHQFFRQVTSDLVLYDTALILINHVMTTIPTDFFSKQLASRGVKQQTRPGGTSIEYYSSLRIDFKQTGKVKEEVYDPIVGDMVKREVGTDVVATVFKNKQGKPGKQGLLRVQYGKGFSQSYSVFQTLVVHGVIKKKPGGHFQFKDEHLPPSGTSIPVGASKILDLLDSETEWLELLEPIAASVIKDYDPDKNDGMISDGDDLIDPATGEVIE